MPSKRYDVEVKFGKKWEYITYKPTHRQALSYIVSLKSHDYPFRIVRIQRTIVFEEKRND